MLLNSLWLHFMQVALNEIMEPINRSHLSTWLGTLLHHSNHISVRSVPSRKKTLLIGDSLALGRRWYRATGGLPGAGGVGTWALHASLVMLRVLRVSGGGGHTKSFQLSLYPSARNSPGSSFLQITGKKIWGTEKTKHVSNGNNILNLLSDIQQALLKELQSLSHLSWRTTEYLEPDCAYIKCIGTVQLQVWQL